ncbi:hypothetical protein [Acidovorax sp. NCPPB 4044]|uniref:hypothetical protein n=1 Tax=Acidovorax sp. NCPPB 4044 TaxID=2940490 RepID=UPI0023043FE4|nr:hypothetical protein [Acidovorax sp. NCPPB 4044]MDA8519559.1 hypothetical protein [Acidovorax sp. NCPPB 4044]
MAPQTHHLTLLADYHQFYLQDEAAEGDLSSAWSDDAVHRMLAVAPGVVGFGTARNLRVPVTLELLDAEPQTDLDRFDHVVEASLVVKTGPLVVAGCTDYFPEAARFAVAPGTYWVRLSAAGLGSLSEDGLEGEDRYLVQVWPGLAGELVVLKQYSV